MRRRQPWRGILATVPFIACASERSVRSDLPFVLEIRAEVVPAQSNYPPGVYLVSVTRNGFAIRQSHQWGGNPLRLESRQQLSHKDISALFALLSTVKAEDLHSEEHGVPVDSHEFTITSYGDWSVKCQDYEVIRCPPRFRELWGSLGSILGPLPGP